MNLVIEKLDANALRKDVPAFRPGDTVRVHVRLKEGGEDKERIQPFEGVVISRRGARASVTSSFTVRRVSFGIGVERIFPLHSPMISTIEVLQRGQVRRSKLYYLRSLRGKAARIRTAAREVRPSKTDGAKS